MGTEKVLVDTSAFYALASSSDEFHSRAKLAYQQLIDGTAELYTSSYVLTECMALIHRRLGFSLLDEFVQSIRAATKIIWATRRVHWESWDLLKQRQGRGLSFVDCTTVVLARSLNADVFAFDGGFLNQGFKVIPTPLEPPGARG